ncbi:MAG: hypothetical protein JSS62_07075 [Verrucomicrobia bacterium]|nr:hypothetical protein [Verrucomicrobiota bacterium]MBS0646733.1 hypothetical protein [Verrucomicrobiota bacterium]
MASCEDACYCRPVSVDVSNKVKNPQTVEWTAAAVKARESFREYAPPSYASLANRREPIQHARKIPDRPPPPYPALPDFPDGEDLDKKAGALNFSQNNAVEDCLENPNLSLNSHNPQKSAFRRVQSQTDLG